MSAATSTLPDQLPPGPRGLPVFGSLLELRHDTHLAIDRLARRYGDVCLLRFGNVPTVIISHPDLLQEAFGRPELADRWVSEIMDILSSQKDLVLAPYGDRWRQMQRFANRELLSARNLDNVRERHIEGVVNGLVDEMVAMGEAGELVSPPVMVARSNSEMMFRSVFRTGRRRHSRVCAVAGRAAATRQLDLLECHRHQPGRLHSLDEVPAQQCPQGSRQAVGDRHGHHGFPGGGRPQPPGLDLSAPTCLVEVMLAEEESGEIESDMINDLCMDLLLAGTDTSAQTVSWTLLLLANRPEVQAKVHEELERVIGPDALPTVDDRTRLPYTFACVAESMRYRTIGPLAVPHQATRDTEVGGYLVPAGAQVLGNIYSIHHDPRFWDSPDDFMPERFLPQPDGSPAAALTSNAFIPFGTGHRRCPGRRFAETAVWLHLTRMLHRLRFETPDGKPLSEAEVFGLAISPESYVLRGQLRS